MKRVPYNLTSRQHVLLYEALRRFLNFHPDEDLLHAWTGLGVPSTYKPAVDAGLMEVVHPPTEPRIIAWWRLTPRGAAVVAEWVSAGCKSETYGSDPYPIPPHQGECWDLGAGAQPPTERPNPVADHT